MPTEKQAAPAPRATFAPDEKRRPDRPDREETGEKRPLRARNRPGVEIASPSENETASEPDIETPGVDGVSEIYVSVGRRDGAKPSDYQAVLESAGLTEDEVGYVRVRHRHAFVGVKGEALERALGALHGAMIANRKATAEPARRG